MTEEIRNKLKQIQAGKVPEGYKKAKYGIVPEGWVENTLGEYVSEYHKLTNEINTYPVYSSSRQGLMPQAEYYGEKESTETNLGYKIMPNGCVTYRHMSDDDIFHFNINQTGKSVLVSSEYPVFSANQKGCLYYLVSLLNEVPRFKYFCREQKMGGTRTRLYYKNLCSYMASFPPLPEQQKIAEILMQCDKVIALKEERIEETKRLKKTCLRKMFPQDGQTSPEIRFPGFTGAWEQRKVGELIDDYLEKTTIQNQYPVLTSSQQQGIVFQEDYFADRQVTTNDNIGYYVLPKGFFTSRHSSFFALRRVSLRNMTRVSMRA